MGEALSRELVRRGWQVAMADIEHNEALSTELGDRTSFHTCHAADYDSQAVASQGVRGRYGRLDATCANADIVGKRRPCACTL